MRAYESAGNVIETHQHTGDFKRAVGSGRPLAPAGAIAEFFRRQSDGELSQKVLGLCDGRCFRCVSDANSIKSENHV